MIVDNNKINFFSRVDKTPYFIAEVSSNHGQDLNRCIEFIDCAADIGCDAVKFQLFKIDQLFSIEALNKKPDLLKRKDWELPLDFLKPIKLKCEERKLHFGCSPFYLSAVSELYPYVDFYKIASYELIWLDLIKECSQTGLPLVLSTGMATLDEIKNACNHVAKYSNFKPHLLHCTSSYPTPITEANLSAISTIRNDTQCDVGWSDHTVSASVIFRAIHKWSASIIEFHLDLDGNGDEYKTGHCWLPEQMKMVIENIRSSILCDGNGIKEPVLSEIYDRAWRADPSDGLRPLLSTRLKL